MAILTPQYVDNAIGTGTREALVGTATGTGSAFLQHEAAARAIVASRAAVKGYTIAEDTDNDFVRLLVLGQWYALAGGLKKGLELPPAIADAMAKLDQVAKTGDGALPIPGLSPSTRDGVGGVRFSRTSGPDGRRQYLSRKALVNW